MQGEPLTPTIFNIVVDALILHWVVVVVGEDAGYEGFKRAVKKLAALFYLKYGIIASP